MSPLERPSVHTEFDLGERLVKKRALVFPMREAASLNLTRPPNTSRELEVHTASIERTFMKNENTISNLNKKIYLMEREVTQLKDLNRRLTYENERLEVQAVSSY